MELFEIKMSNFFSFREDVTIDLSTAPSPILIKGELGETGGSSNGAGKSSIFEGVYWALTGKTIRGVRAKDVIRVGTKFCEVALLFSYKDSIVSVVRYYSENKKSIVVQIDKEEHKFHDMAQGTDFLFAYLEVTPQILAFQAFFGRSFQTFSQLSPRERADLIDILAKGDHLESLRATERAKSRELNQTADTLKAQIAALSSDIVAMEDDKKSALAAIASHEKGHSELIKRESKKAEDLLETYNSREKELAEFHKSRKTPEPIEDILAQDRVFAESIKEHRKKAQSATAEIQSDEDTYARTLRELESKVARTEVTLASHLAALESLETSVQESRCRECDQVLESLDAQKRVKARRDSAQVDHDSCAMLLKNSREELKKHQETYATIEESSEKLVATVVACEADISAAEDSRSSIQAQIQSHSALVAADLQELARRESVLQDAQNAHQQQARQLASIKEADPCPALRGQLSALETQLTGSLNKKVGLQSTMEDSLVTLKLAKYWEQAFKDLRFSTFNGVVQVLQELLTAYCSQQSLEFDRIEVTSWKENSDGGQRPFIEIFVYRGDERLALDSLSEGERQRVDLSCFFAIGSLLKSSTGNKINLRILDEPLTGLDFSGKDRAFGMLEDAAEDAQVFVIDHDAHFQDRFSHIITVRKDAQGSYVG